MKMTHTMYISHYVKFVYGKEVLFSLTIDGKQLVILENSNLSVLKIIINFLVP